MREITIKIYKFDELTEEVQQSAISKLSDINVDYDWWDIDGLLDLTQDEMDGAKIKPSEIENLLISYKIEAFELGGHQYIQFVNVIVNNEEAFRKFLKIPEGLWDQCSYYFTNNSRDCNTHFELETDEEPANDDNLHILDRAAEIMNNKIHEAWVSLKNDYEHRTSEEAIKDTILTNEYEFYEDGKLI